MAEQRYQRAKLEALTRATDDLRPSDGFTDAVVARCLAHERVDDPISQGEPLAAVASGEVASGEVASGEAASAEIALTKLARATDNLEPSEAMSDAIMIAILSEKTLQTEAPSEATLERAARLTTDLSPSDNFVSTVMAALPSALGGRARWPWAEAVTRSSRSVLLVAAALAAAAMLFCSYTEQRLDADVVSSVDPIEVSE